MTLLVAVGARLAPGLGALLLLSAFPFDVALLATAIALSVGMGIVSSGVLVVAVFLLGVSIPIRFIFGVE